MLWLRDRVLVRFVLLCGGVFILLLGGCAGPDSFGGTRAAVSAWAEAKGFVVEEVLAQPFALLRATRIVARNAGIITIYIEGDGAPWPSPWYPPHDPTPIKPIALALAAADPTAALAYFGRPCQYLSREALSACSRAYWSTRRFAPEVIAAYDNAIDELKKASGTERLRLVGYSGGGVIATMLAAHRRDVVLLVTVAAPLAVAEWVRVHGLSPLTGSLDPDTISAGLPPSVHWVGDHDRVVPSSIIEHFIARHGGRRNIAPGFDHECCWSEHWASIIAEIYSEERMK